MTLLETDILAIIIALGGSIVVMLLSMRHNYKLQKENRRLRAALQRYTKHAQSERY